MWILDKIFTNRFELASWVYKKVHRAIRKEHDKYFEKQHRYFEEQKSLIAIELQCVRNICDGARSDYILIKEDLSRIVELKNVLEGQNGLLEKRLGFLQNVFTRIDRLELSIRGGSLLESLGGK